VELSFLSPLYAQRGPYATAYLDTSRDVDDPERAIGLRWRHLRDELTAQGADMATVEAVARVVGTDQDLPGRHGQAIFAAHGRLALAEELPEPPARDRARFAILPDAMPLAVQHAPDIPYAAVAVRRVEHAEGGAVAEGLEVELQVGRWPISKVAADERAWWSEPADGWSKGAVQLADKLAKLADHDGADVVVLSGDIWARGVLVHALPKQLRERVIGVEADGREFGAERARLEDELEELFRGRLAARDQVRLDRFLKQRASDRSSVEGMIAVVAALGRGQAQALLVNPPVDLPVQLWVGAAPQQIGFSAAELRSFGVEDPWAEPADAALIRAAAGTGAELIVVPAERLEMQDGLGALLRYSVAGTET
jgi:hypothetical protein